MKNKYGIGFFAAVIIIMLVISCASSFSFYNAKKEVKEEIEKRGGKVTGSVTSKTSYLINNDTRSASSKNRKAKELGIPIISEEMFLKMIEEGV